jgi:hypothetical protein
MRSLRSRFADGEGAKWNVLVIAVSGQGSVTIWRPTWKHCAADQIVPRMQQLALELLGMSWSG